MLVCVGVHNAPHYVLYSGVRRQKERGKKKGPKLNCCKIWPLGKHDYLLKPHYGRKSLGYCWKRVIACYYDSGRCGRQGQREGEWERQRKRERWKSRATSKSVPAISARDHRTITQRRLKTLPLSCPFMLQFSAADAGSTSALSKYFHCPGCSSPAESNTPISTIQTQNAAE